MGLRDAMRKAAGLLVELPPEQPADEFIEPAEVLETSGKKGNPPPDIDKLLADAGIKRSVPGGASPAPSPKPGPTKTVEQIVKEAPGPSLDDIRQGIKVAPADTPLLPNGDVNFEAIFRAAKLPDAPFGAEKMLEMMANLPPDVSLEIKRQMVKVTLGALGASVGATPENIVADASRKLAALAAFAENYSRQSTQSVERLEKEIGELQESITTKKAAIESTRERGAKIAKACDAHSDRLDDVLEFFSLDLPPSKYAAPSAPKSPPEDANKR